MKLLLATLGASAILLAACACAAHASLRAAAKRSDTWSDPFAYCRAVGTIDHPDTRYAGPDPPPAVIAGVRKAMGISPDSPVGMAKEGTYWRCMGGHVYGCNVGANLPCEEKAVVSREPTEAERGYCRQNPGTGFIPMYVTEHATIYAWACKGPEPVIVKTIAKADARGYIAGIWYLIRPPSG